MSYIIKPKHNNMIVDKSLLETRKNRGNSIGKNRILTIINDQINENVKVSSKILFLIISYLFRSWNYIHNPRIANGKSTGEKIYDWLSWISIFLFIILLFTGVVKPFIEAGKAGFSGDLENFWQKLLLAFSLPDNIVVLSFAAFFLIISVLYLFLFFKIRKNNEKLSLDAYVSKKISFCLKLRFLIKFNKEHLKIIHAKETDVIVIDNFETNGDNDKWTYLQMYNLLSSIFLNLKFCFAFTNYDPVKLDYLYEVIKWDFKNIEIVEVDSDPMEAFKKRNEEIIPLTNHQKKEQELISKQR